MEGPSANVSDCDTEEMYKTEEQPIGSDTTKTALSNIRVTSCDILWIIIAICTYILDVGFDIFLAYQFYRDGDMIYFYPTLLFIIFPGVVNAITSCIMYVIDEELSVSKLLTRKWIVRIIVLLFQLAPLLRYCDGLWFALKARWAEKANDKCKQKKYCEMMLKENSDVALLRVFEGFLEAAPQAVLQITILLIDSKSFTWIKVGSICTSLISMSWSMASYQRAIRFVQEDKQNMSIAGSAIQLTCHLLITMSRILAVSIVASLYPQWTLLACAGHWTVMVSWLMLCDRVALCVAPKGAQQFGELLFCSILGLVYIFTYLTTVHGRSRYQLYYSLCFIENIVMAFVWCLFAPPFVTITSFYSLFFLAFVPFIVGAVLMVYYYKVFRPNNNHQPNEASAEVTCPPCD